MPEKKSRKQVLQEIKKLDPRPEIKSKAVLPKERTENYEYGLLEVEENLSHGGIINFNLKFGEYDEFEATYSISRDTGRKFQLLEGLSRGEDYSIWERIYSDSYSSSSFKEHNIETLLENDKLPEDYREPLNNFLHDVFWE